MRSIVDDAFAIVNSHMIEGSISPENIWPLVHAIAGSYRRSCNDYVGTINEHTEPLLEKLRQIHKICKNSGYDLYREIDK